MLFFIPLVVALHYGIARPYITTADMDLTVAAHALHFNSGMPQHHYDHPGYVNFLLFSWWIKASGLLNLIPAHTWNGVLSSPDPESAFASVVIAGRVYSAIVAGMFAVLFYQLLRLLTGNNYVSWLGTLALAFSAGLVSQSLILRPELLSSLFILLALHQLVKAANGIQTGRSTIISLALAGSAAMLALMTKLQAIFALLMLAAGISLFGQSRNRRMQPVLGASFNPERLGYVLAVVAFASPALALAVSYIHASWVWSGPYLPQSGYYQIVVAAYLAAATAFYAWTHKRTMAEWCFGMAALVAGMAAMVYLNFIKFLDQNIVALANFIDWLRHYAVSSIRRQEDLPLSDMLQLITVSASPGHPSPAYSLLARHITIDGISERPGGILLWVALIAAGYLYAKRERIVAFRILLFLAMATLLELIFTLRYMDIIYLIYIEPWIIIAYALAISRLLNIVGTKKIIKATASTLTGVYILLSLQISSHSRFLDLSITDINNVNNVCVFTHGTPIYPWAKHHCDPETQEKLNIGG